MATASGLEAAAVKLGGHRSQGIRAFSPYGLDDRCKDFRKIVRSLNEPRPANAARQAQVMRIAQYRPGGFLCSQGRSRSFGYEPPLFLGQSRVEMQHEGIGVSAPAQQP